MKFDTGISPCSSRAVTAPNGHSAWADDAWIFADGDGICPVCEPIGRVVFETRRLVGG
jgi:hypothetical protein